MRCTILGLILTALAPLAWAHQATYEEPEQPALAPAELEELLLDPLILDRVAATQAAALHRLIVGQESLSGDLYEDTGLSWEARRWLATTCLLVPDAVEAVSPLIVLEPMHERTKDKQFLRELATETLAGVIAQNLVEIDEFEALLDAEFVAEVTKHPDSLAAAVVAKRWFENHPLTADHREVFCQDVDRPLCAVATSQLRSLDQWLAGLSPVDLSRVADPFGVHPPNVRAAANKLLTDRGAPAGGDLEFASGLVDLTLQMKLLAGDRNEIDFATSEGAIRIENLDRWRPFIRGAVWRMLDDGEKVDIQVALEAAQQHYERLAEKPRTP